MRTAVVKFADGKTQAASASTRPPGATHPLLGLQRSAGNQAMQRALSGGSPLPRELRGPLEGYFRTPLDRVRIHNDEASQSFADSVGARAFTVGQNIHLGSDGARATGSDLRKLVAHEVVHTLQQGQVGPRAKLKVGPAHDRHEQQAERIAESFTHGGIAEQVESVGAPAIQRAMHRAHYGTWEDAIYRTRQSDATGADMGVEMHLKFHPNQNAIANVIGLTQTAMNTVSGRAGNAGVLGVREATSGAGVGRAIDRVEGQPNPLYATSPRVRRGGSRARMQDYETEPIVPLVPPVDGQRFDGWGRHGSGRMVGGTFTGTDAELYDATFQTPVLPDSGQLYETTALAVGGFASTYFGSVEWGWRTDAAGTMTTVPFRVVSQGAPSADFLTAAFLWNASRTDLAYDTTASAVLREVVQLGGGSARVTVVGTVPANERVEPTGASGNLSGNQVIEVTYQGVTGYANASALRPVAVGPETLDLPVPMIHTVTNPAGSTMLRNATAGATPANSLLLAPGSRVTTTRCMRPTATLPNHYEGTVVDGPQTGARGFFFVPDLTLERLGTR
ncbi:MAG TPA: DUF4157 domain-containing protein [Thermoanaerobaculia bacterium]|jgi:hypothetical protein